MGGGLSVQELWVEDAARTLNMALSYCRPLPKILAIRLSDRHPHPYIPNMIARVFAGFAWAGFLFWTLICLGLWAVVALGGDVLAWLAGAALDPAAGGTVTSVLRFLEAFGTALIAWFWIAGSVLIAVAGTILRRAAANATVVRMSTIRTASWREPEMKDVTPPDTHAPVDEIRRLPPR